MSEPNGYTKAKRRRFTKYARRLDERMRRAIRPIAIETRRETWDFLRSAKTWAPWALTTPPAMLVGGLPVLLVDDLEIGRFRITESGEESAA